LVNCRYTDAWVCKLYRKEGERNVVDTEVCQLCMKAKEITRTALMMDTAKYMCSEMNKAIRTMNTYTSRLTRALEKLEDET